MAEDGRMVTASHWIEGARPRTLPNSIAPVIVGAGAAAATGAFVWWQSLLALLVAFALQVGVNYANDYSDGIRGTDADRVGPLRLVGSGLASPGAVRTAAFGCFGVGALAGLVLVAATGRWWLIGFGAVCIAGAWFYTGGGKPYGYLGFGELAVFLFFGPAAVLGTLYVQSGGVTWAGLLAAGAMGTFSAAVLVANNLRDVPTDREAGKRTLAVRLGDHRTRMLYFGLVGLPFAVTIGAAVSNPWLLAGLLAVIPVIPAIRRVASGETAAALIPVLRDTGLAMLVWGLTTGAALAFA